MTTKTVKTEWLDFKANALKGCPKMQTEEMQKAFYMGIISGLNIILSIPDEATEKEHEKIFDGIFGEADRFIKSLK